MAQNVAYWFLTSIWYFSPTPKVQKLWELAKKGKGEEKERIRIIHSNYYQVDNK